MSDVAIKASAIKASGPLSVGAPRAEDWLCAVLGKFPLAFPSVFAIAYASWIVGSYAYVAAVTPAEQQKFGIDWSLKLTNEGGFLVALLSGLVIANFFPRFAEWLKDAVRPDVYI